MKNVPALFYPVVKETSHSVHDVLFDPSCQMDVFHCIAENYDVPALLRMTELWSEAYQFGCDVEFTERTFPRIRGILADDIDDLNEISMPSYPEHLIRGAEECVRNIEIPLTVGVTGPYTLASVLNGSENFMMSCMTDDDTCHEFLDRLTDWLAGYVREYEKIGIKSVMICEPSTGMISPDMMKEFSIDYIQRIIDSVGTDIIYHSCADVNPHLDVISTLSCPAFHFGSAVDIRKAREKISGDRIVMGNMDPQHFLTGNTDDLEAERNRIVSSLDEMDNCIFSTGCDLSPGVRTENLEMFRR